MSNHHNSGQILSSYSSETALVEKTEPLGKLNKQEGRNDIKRIRFKGQVCIKVYSFRVLKVSVTVDLLYTYL